MTEQFVIYLPDPFGVNASVYAVATRTNLLLLEPLEIRADVKTISYELPVLIDDLRRNNVPLPGDIIDISEAIRLSIGISKADGGEQKWGFWKRIKTHFGSAPAWRQARDIFEGRATRPEGDELMAVVGGLANAVVKLWVDIQALLDSSQELRRFFEVEVPVAQIFYQRQFDGIAIAPDKIAKMLEIAASEKYISYRKIADILDVSPTGLNYWNIQRYLGDTDVPILDDDVNGYSLRDRLRMASEKSVFAQAFTEYMDASRDVSVLTRLADANHRVFPVFHPCGTISARILVSDPHIQELRKRFRHVVAGDEGMDLVYFDYSQFEPGIMASLSGDKSLIDLYNQGDVYAALSIALFGDASSRDLCIPRLRHGAKKLLAW